VPPADALGALAVLGFVCTALGLVLFFRLIVEAGPSRASVITYVNPLVAVVLGVLVLDERVGAMSLVGLLAILGGSWLSTRGVRGGAAAAVAADATADGRRSVGPRRDANRPRAVTSPRVPGRVGDWDGRAAHRANRAWTRTRHSRRARARLTSVARRVGRTCRCRVR
jgi:hypothetical protein